MIGSHCTTQSHERIEVYHVIRSVERAARAYSDQTLPPAERIKLVQELHRIAAWVDNETENHVHRVGAHAAALALASGWSPETAEDLRIAAILHDIGKIGVSPAILNKPGPLTEKERSHVQMHTRLGHRLLGPVQTPMLVLAREVAYSHHERWDGTGYPRQLTGEAIPVSARITALADVYDALVHDRPYRCAYTSGQALQIMDEGRACQFDPQLFDIFVQTLPDYDEIITPS